MALKNLEISADLRVIQAVLIDTIHVLQIPYLHYISFQFLLENFLVDCIPIRIIDYSHPFQAVVIQPQKCSSSYFVCNKQVSIFISVLGTMSSVPFSDVLFGP